MFIKQPGWNQLMTMPLINSSCLIVFIFGLLHSDVNAFSRCLDNEVQDLLVEENKITLL